MHLRNVREHSGPKQINEVIRGFMYHFPERVFFPFYILRVFGYPRLIHRDQVPMAGTEDIRRD
ncbi:hypothetical protein MPL1032_180059 [Mesorhizobium plurifarium]|uniref:Uncharacterized protein n=1 Tax=Mesorhizobium plurifarium TaxID=69974 RepID=A0A0K2VTI6_MESPL|nr:hypothetical protein MPL1032_180059 [Mesorhizobium plurifarium]